MFELRISRRMLAEIIVDKIVYLAIAIFTKEVLPNFFLYRLGGDYDNLSVKRMFMLIEDLKTGTVTVGIRAQGFRIRI